jgi:hypothetical protein
VELNQDKLKEALRRMGKPVPQKEEDGSEGE